MNAKEMSFGIEIETTIPHGTLNVGPHGSGFSIPGMPGWKADRDPSIVAGAEREACEFVSPVYFGDEGFAAMVVDLAKIKAMGAKVNASCGLHVHVGCDKNDKAGMKRLITLVANFEKALYAASGTKSREQGRWCGSIQRHGDVENATQHAEYNRYHVMNIATGSKPTVEFRAFAATLNLTKLVATVRLCVGLVERAFSTKRATDWTPRPQSKRSGINRRNAGDGTITLNRLFYQLGWTKGRSDRMYGNLEAAAAPSVKACKKELIRLGRKYDGVGVVAANDNDGGEIVMNEFGLPLTGHRVLANGRVAEYVAGVFAGVLQNVGPRA